MSMQKSLTFTIALASSLAVLPQLATIANRIGLVDVPDERKRHNTPKPLVGGIGIVISATFSSLLFVPLSGLRGFFSGLAVLLLAGFLDDFTGVGHWKKFIAQICATGLLIYLSKICLIDFGNLIGIGPIVIPKFGGLIWCVTIFCVVGVTNALNMIDGLDGLAGGIAFISFLSFSFLAYWTGNCSLTLVNLGMAGAILGFLWYNWFPARLFMGDAGSLCLGFSLSFMAIALTQIKPCMVPPVVPLMVLAVPISDTLSVMLRRIICRRNPFLPDRTHLHYLLVDKGLRQTTVVYILIMLASIFSGLGLAGIIFKIPEPILFAIFITYFSVNIFSGSIFRGNFNISQ